MTQFTVNKNNNSRTPSVCVQLNLNICVHTDTVRKGWNNKIKMDRIGYFALFFIVICWSCCREAEDNRGESDTGKIRVGIVHFNIELGLSKRLDTRVPGAPGNEILIQKALDSLIKDIRILVFNTTTQVCEGHADFAPIRISEIDTLSVTCSVGQKDFIFVSNVCLNEAMKMPVIGLKKEEILVVLDEYISGNKSLRNGSRNHFWGEVPGVTVSALSNPSFPVEIWRMEGRLETKVAVNNIWLQDKHGADSLKVMDGYIKRLRAISIWYSSPDINMKQGVNNNPLLDSDSVVVSDTLWRKISIDTSYNQLQLFPTDAIARPGFFAVLFAAEVDTTYVDFTPNPADMVVPGGGVIRYWWLRIDTPIRRNVRLQFTVTKLKGAGSPYLPEHKPEIDAVFTISVKDWDPLADFIEGNTGDFYE